MPPPSINQKPEQIARDRVDAKLAETGWHVQDEDQSAFGVGPGIAVREYPTDIGPVDYVLFAGRRAIGVIEAKTQDWAQDYRG